MLVVVVSLSSLLPQDVVANSPPSAGNRAVSREICGTLGDPAEKAKSLVARKRWGRGSWRRRSLRGLQ